MHSALIRWLIAGCWLFLSTAACAAGCAIDGAQVAFGRLDPLSQEEQQAIGTITLLCDGVEGGVVRVGLGAGESMRFEARELSDGVHRIRYNLYLDPAHQRVFGDDSSGAGALSLALPPSGVPLTIPVYAVIARGQRLSPGTYSDEIVVSVDF